MNLIQGETPDFWKTADGLYTVERIERRKPDGDKVPLYVIDELATGRKRETLTLEEAEEAIRQISPGSLA